MTTCETELYNSAIDSRQFIFNYYYNTPSSPSASLCEHTYLFDFVSQSACFVREHTPRWNNAGGQNLHNSKVSLYH